MADSNPAEEAEATLDVAHSDETEPVQSVPEPNSNDGDEETDKAAAANEREGGDQEQIEPTNAPLVTNSGLGEEAKESEHGEDSDSNDEPEEISFMAAKDTIDSERQQRTSSGKRRKREFKEPPPDVDVCAPLDESIFASLDQQDQIAEIKSRTANKKRRKKDKTVAALPSEKGIQMFRQKKIKNLSVTSESAMSFRDRMLNRHKRVSAEQSKHQRLKVKQCRVR